MTLEVLPKVSLIDALRRNGFKATPQRIAICNFALSSRDHPTAQEIYGQVKKVYPTVSLTTVYKTLQVLKQLHLIQELPLSGGERFDSYMEPHINIMCVRCGEVLDINDRSARDMVERAAAKTRYTLTGQRFDIYGVCAKCKEGKKPLSRQRICPHRM